MSFEAALADRYREIRHRLIPTKPSRRPLPVIEAEPIREVVAEVSDRLRVIAATEFGRLPTIIRLVAQHYKLKPHDLTSRRQDQKPCLARFTAIFLAKEYTPLSYTDLGRRFGGRDHTSILHSVRTTAKRLSADPEYAAAVDEMRGVLDEVFKPTEAGVGPGDSRDSGKENAWGTDRRQVDAENQTSTMSRSAA